jgi:esterase/lipase superfamily enzyme
MLDEGPVHQTTEGYLMKFIVLVISLLCSIAKAQPEQLNQCEGFSQDRPWAYCISRTPGSTNRDILYFIHGAGDSEKTWIKDYGDIREAWALKGKQAPTVISMSFGPVWLMVAKNNFKTSGLLNWIPNVQMPWLEAKIGGLQPGGKRLILSKSMGGFNSTQLMFNYPEMFSKVAMLCPAIVSHSPFSGLPVIQDFIKRTGAAKQKAFWTMALFRSFFPALEFWQKAAPYYADPTRLNSKSPELYVTCGNKDQWGFFEGAKHFAELAKQNGVRHVIWDHVIDGGHHEYKAQAIADFLVP